MLALRFLLAGSFFVSSPDLPCTYDSWAVFFTVVWLFALACIPILAWFLYSKHRSTEWNDDDFRKRFGTLFENYRSEF